MQKKIYLLFIIFLLFSTYANASQVKYSPDEINVEKHEFFEVDIIISPSQNIDTIGINKITWDADVIVLDEIKKGDFFIDPLVWIEGQQARNNLTYMCMASNEEKNTDGKIATLSFRAREDGTTYITSKSEDIDLALAGERRNVTVTGCKVIVGSGVPPSEGLNFPVEYLLFFVVITTIIIAVFVYFKKFYVPKKTSKNKEIDNYDDYEDEEDIFG